MMKGADLLLLLLIAFVAGAFIKGLFGGEE